MEMSERERFLTLWRRFFGEAELPIAFYYTDREDTARPARHPIGHRCLIASLVQVRRGGAVRFDRDSIGCSGGRRYLGFSDEIMPDFEYFLSYGIPGRLEGERYKKSPELVRQFTDMSPRFTAPHRFIVFKRWDALEARDDPAVVIFFARPDVLSGLFTLANFDEVEPNGVFTPFAAGCGTIVQYPYLERDVHQPRAVIGMFDVSARPHVPGDALSFAVPMNKFRRMLGNMEESFLTTGSWGKVRKRLM